MSSNTVHPLIQEKRLPERRYVLANRQGGAVLVISLIILLLMTLIGTTGMQTASLEEKMAGNMRDRNLAFQAAESALKAGETFLGTQTTAQLAALVFDCAGPDGLYTQSGTGCAGGQPIWDTIVWNGNSVLYAGNLAHVPANPMYIIEDMGQPDCGGIPSGCHRFRVTARATGGTAEAVVMLQSIFQRPK